MTVSTFGMPLIWLSLAGTALSTALYLKAAAGTPDTGNWESATKNVANLGRIAYFVALVALAGACIVHSTLLLTHDFSVDYVYRYSSRALPIGYLFATFWAGQDGSFLLWAFWIAVLGQVASTSLSSTVRARFMATYSPVLLFLLVILVVRNPFAAYVPGQGEPLHPTDGIGLNPLLENPWMVVHPPTLFLGFAALTIPFAFATMALLWGDDSEWYRRAWPWALFSFAVLGLGVMLGGYWAYETLGWGGFWGWDPVENGPLVPWLLTVALLHAMQVNRASGALKKSTLILAQFGFVSALYETFLTRTGILDKFSNHSFSTLGGTANGIVLYGLLFAVAGSLALLAWRARQVTSEARVWDHPTSRDFGMTLAVAVLVIVALIVAAGMSAPLITGVATTLHLMSGQSSVSPDFYDKANYPIAVILGLGMAIGPYLSWRATEGGRLRPLWASALCAVLATLVFGIVGADVLHARLRPEMMLLFLSSSFAVLANAQIIATRRGAASARRPAGGAVAHIGAALIFIGVVGLVLFTHKESPFLAQNQPVRLDSLPYTITYAGMTSDLFHPDNQLRLLVASATGKPLHTMLMPFAVRNVEGRRQLLARPAISMMWWGDLYLAFQNGPTLYSPNRMDHFTISRGQSCTVDGYKISLLGYSVPPDVDAQVAQGIVPERYPVTALLRVTAPGGRSASVSAVNIRYRDDPIAPAEPESLLPSAGKASLPEAIAFEGMDTDSGQASFYVRQANTAPFAAFTIEVSTRPTIGLVWLGTLLIFVGGLMSQARRLAENRLSPIADPVRSSPPPKQTNRNGRSAPDKSAARAGLRKSVHLRT